MIFNQRVKVDFFFSCKLYNRHILPVTFQLELHFALTMLLFFNFKILTLYIKVDPLLLRILEQYGSLELYSSIPLVDREVNTKEG